MAAPRSKIYWKGIVIHCSDSAFGTVELIDRWHRERGFAGIGYHYVITNGLATKGANYDIYTDGKVYVGRNLKRYGAHAVGYNDTHIGICLIGVDKFTNKQFESLWNLILKLCKDYVLGTDQIIGHRDCVTAKGKTCPNFDVQDWIKKVRGY